MYHVGIDWADQKYDVTIVNQTGEIIGKNLTIAKNITGFEKLITTLRTLSENTEAFKIGIETPHNLLTDYLMDLGYAVFALHPGAMKSLRKRYRQSTARDDEFDAYVLADVMRTDKACWQNVDFGCELIREIRILVRDHHQFIGLQTALGNRLRSVLKMYYPEYIHFFSDVTCKTSLAFIDAYPDFRSAQRLSQEQLNDFFKEHHFRNQRTINKIYELLHGKHLSVPRALQEAKKIIARGCVKMLSETSAILDTYLKRLKLLLDQHPDSKLFLSYPGVGYTNAARLLALFGDNRRLYTNVSELTALTGTCPVTEKTGNSRVIYYRRSCNKFYRDIIHQIAFCSLKESQWAKAYYRKHRAMGKKHNHALRCLANIHLRILFAMWKTRTCYDEKTFLAKKAAHAITTNKW